MVLPKKVLVVLPFFNTEEILNDTIQSILQQTYPNIFLCLVDDGSTDKSLQIAKSYESRSNVLVLRNEVNLGTYRSINKALFTLRNQEWDYFTLHGGDDISDLRRFKKIIEYLEKDSTLVGTKTTFVRVHFENKQIAYENGSQHITTTEGIPFYKRIVFERIGYFDNVRYSGDTEYYRRLLAWCRNNPGHYMGAHTEPLYIAYLRGNKNLTVQTPIVDRIPYFNQIVKDIEVRERQKDFYRQFEP